MADIKKVLAAYKKNTQVPETPATGVGRQKGEVGRIPASAQFLAKIPRAPDGPFEKKSREDQAKEPKFRRVAKFLILIGSEEASKVLANLPEDQVELISQEIALIRGISSDEAAGILDEFDTVLSGTYGYSGSSRGGTDEARKLLYAAFGPEKGEALLRRSVPAVNETVFNFLEDFTGEQIALILRDESPAAGALVLSRINPKLSAAALAASGGEWRKEAVRRIARLGRVSPEVLVQVAGGLREKARHIGRTSPEEIDGKGVLAAILKQSDISFGDKILSDLAVDNADLSHDIKERLYTTDDVIKADDRPIQEKLQTMSLRDIAVLIKNRPAEFTEKILSNISANRRVELRSECDFLGPVPKKDCEEAIKIFMNWFRTGCEEGSILLEGDELVE
ncbi:MAG: flagellar motor switch protein FliG [Spirochaetaceae bacterium]|jgi:flagellar motor switch protein FliG|nr:flagellar motor switch protein FliG [Spirochaetaceae bacterium]